MGVVATFDPALFVQRYPEFTSVDDQVLALYFSEATLYLANDGTGPINDVGQQLLLLNMLTAHVAKLAGAGAGPNGTTTGPSGLVGRISSASEGSVSVSADLSGVPGSAAWYAQTSYGLSFWQVTARFRRARYVVGPVTTAPWAGGFPYGGYPGFVR